MRWTEAQLNDYLARRPLQNPEPERHQTPALERADAGKKESVIDRSLSAPDWTPSEDAVLVAYYANAEVGKRFIVQPLVDVLKRSEAAIHCRANALGICFQRGKYPRNKPDSPISKAKYTDDERRRIRSESLKLRHATIGHPMTGRHVPQDVRDKISAANKGRKVPPDCVMRSLRTKSKNGTMAPINNGRSWKSGWRKIGGKRIYARSRWEANYARYLEFLKNSGELMEWEHEPETFWFEEIKRGCRSYLPDFRVTLKTGAVEYHEVKGWMDARSKTKIRRMAKYHPNVKLLVIDAKWFRGCGVKLRGLIPDWEHGKLS